MYYYIFLLKLIQDTEHTSVTIVKIDPIISVLLQIWQQKAKSIYKAKSKI